MKRFEFHVNKNSRSITGWEPKYQNIFLKKFVATKTFTCKADLEQEALEILFVSTGLASDSWSDFGLDGISSKAIESARRIGRGVKWAVSNIPEIEKIVKSSTVKFDNEGDVVFENWPKIKIAYLKATGTNPDNLKGDQKIIKFFKELDGLVDLGLSRIYPLVPEQWQGGAEYVEREKKDNKDLAPKDKFNATSIHSIGSKIGLNGGEDEAAKKFESRVAGIERAVNNALANSKLDTQFFGKKLNAKVVNGAFPALVIKSDYSDDGDDEYGVKLLWKFSYAR